MSIIPGNIANLNIDSDGYVFTQRVVDIWNTLPEEIVESDS